MPCKSAYTHADSYVSFENVFSQEAAEGEDGGRKHRGKKPKKKEDTGGR
jgi:hypothetical protein